MRNQAVLHIVFSFLFCFHGYVAAATRTGYYHETRSGVTNVGVSMLRNMSSCERFNIPLGIAFVYSPLTKQATVVVGIGIN